MGYRPIGDQLLHVAVVLGELHQLVVAPQVDAAVANPGHFEAAAADAGGHDGGAHGQCVVAAAGDADDFLVGDPDCGGKRRAIADLADDGLAGQCAGDLAIFVPAHSVSDQPQAQFTVPVIGVLVEFPTQADMRQVSEFDHWETAARRGFRKGERDNRGGAAVKASAGSARPKSKTPLERGVLLDLAEREGFEPSVRYKRTPDFESGTFNHSATSPEVGRE